MKKFLIILLVVVALVVAGGLVFFYTFNWDWAKQTVLEKVEESLGRKVTVDRIGFSFQGGPSLSMRGVTIQDSPVFSEKPCVTIDRLNLSVNVGSLLRRELQIGDIQLKSPHVRVIRNNQGLINLSTLGAKKNQVTPTETPTTASKAPSQASVPFQLVISKLSVENGSLEWIDEQSPRPLILTLDQIETTIRAQHMIGPFEIKGKARMMSENGQNINFDLNIPADSKGIILTKIKMLLEVNPTNIDWTTLKATLPQAAFLPLEGKAIQKGKIQCRIEGFLPNIGFWGSIRAQDLSVKPKDALVALEASELVLSATPEELKTEKGLMKVGQGTVDIQLHLQHYFQKPIGEGRIIIQGLQMNDVLPAPKSESEPRLYGLLNEATTFKFDLDANGNSIMHLEGNAELTGGKLTNLNLANMIFGRITALPGLREALLGGVSPYYQDLLKQNDTNFEKCTAQFNIVSNTFYLTNLTAYTADYGIEAEGLMNRDQTIQLRGTMKASQDLTQQIVGKVNEAIYITDFQNRFTVPFLASGTLAHPRVAPDISQITQMIIARKGREQIDKSLQKFLGNKVAPSSTGSAPTTSSSDTAQTVQSLIQDFLQR